MKLNFVTLFNSAYLSRGIVMYESLLKHCSDFHLYVIAFDELAYNYLKKANLNFLTPVSLAEFEDNELLKVKATRSAAEYCWTCTPSTILYCIKKFNLSNCTYVDADMCFYSNPLVLVEEMKDKFVLITEHRYTPQYDQSDKSGKYCVQFITVFNRPEGMEVIDWWRKACINWCYARHEDGKFGDQKYLEEWPLKFSSIHELQHLGGGLAPWNIQQYRFVLTNQGIIGTKKDNQQSFEAVFFHFHSLKFFDNNIVSLCDSGYEISKEIQEIFYKPYVRLLEAAKKRIMESGAQFNPHGSFGAAPYGPMSLKTVCKYYTNGLRKSKRNAFGTHLFKSLKHHYFFNSTSI